MYLGPDKIKSTKEDGEFTIITIGKEEKKLPTTLFNAIKTKSKIEEHEMREKKYRFIARQIYTILANSDITEIELEPVMTFLRENLKTTLIKLVFNQFKEKELDPAITDFKQEITLGELYNEAYK